MVKYSESHLDATFAALSGATRRGILARLAQGEISVSELAAPYRMSLPAVGKHLRVLASARLIVRRKNGRVFQAPRGRVWAAWTQREQLEEWMCKDVPTHNPKYVELDVRPGGVTSSRSRWRTASTSAKAHFAK